MFEAILTGYRSRYARSVGGEIEQALVRIALILVVGVYFSTSYMFGSADQGTLRAAWSMLAFLVFALLLFAHNVIYPDEIKSRRFISMLADFGTNTLVMHWAGETAAVCYIIYLWVLFGYGFRFGRQYLYAASAMAVIGFVLVAVFTPYWQANLSLTLGLALGLIILPAYVSKLLQRLQISRLRAEEASEAKSRFIATISHEIRTPLNGIIGMADLLAQAKLDPPHREYVETIDIAASTVLSQINDILDIARFQSGKVTIRADDFDLYSLLNSITKMLRSEANEKGLALRCEIDSGVPNVVHGDGQILRQILTNLISNAVKFTKQGEVTIHIERLSTNAEEGHTVLRFSVTDSGIGMTEEAQKRIFDCFEQADLTITRRFGGSGLGTTIVSQLVDLLGGSIAVRSELGKGSTFWCDLPIGIANNSIKKNGFQPLVKHRILVLSSDQVALGKLLAQVQLWGAFAQGCNSASRCYSELLPSTKRDWNYDILLVDGDHLDVAVEHPVITLQADPLAVKTKLIYCATNVNERLFIKMGYSGVVSSNDEQQLLNVIQIALITDQSVGGGVVPEVVDKTPKVAEKLAGLNVLIADDNAINRKVAQRILTTLGHRSVSFASGEEALDALAHQDFDLAIIDLHMPEMDGFEVMRRYCASMVGKQAVPMIALTADVTGNARKQAAAAGASLYLTKPVRPAELKDAIDNLLADAKHSYAEEQNPDHEDNIERAAIDSARVAELAALGKNDEFLAALVKEFLLDANRMLDVLRGLDKNASPEQWRTAVTDLRDSADSMGALLLLRRTESLLDDAVLTTEQLTERYDELATSIVDTQNAFNQYMLREQFATSGQI